MHLLSFEPPRLCRLCFFHFWTSRGAYRAWREKRAFSEGFSGLAIFFFLKDCFAYTYLLQLVHASGSGRQAEGQQSGSSA